MIPSALIRGILLCSLGLAMFASTVTIKREYVQPDDLFKMTLFAQYSAAATCAENFLGKPGSQIYCDPGICPWLGKNTELVTGFTNHHPGNTTGFLAVDHYYSWIVLAFRGTRTIGNVITDGEYEQIPVPEICGDCMVHKGWWNAWHGFSDYIMPFVNDTAAKYPDYSIVFTGHSLGGAIATVGQISEVNPNIPNRPISVYSFGCPQLGNHSLAEYITNVETGTLNTGYRVTHTDDPVPRLLSPSKYVNQTWQYSTTSPEYWITTGNGDPVSYFDVQVIEGIDNKSGNLGQTGNDTAAHEWYISNMSGCSTN